MFTHLHVHTEKSLLDGAAKIKDVVSHAKELGMKSLAITDHGVMFGVVDFYRECKAQGIKPIIGCEVYTSARKMSNKDAKDKKSGHLVLLAKNNEGYQNLIKIVSKAYTEGFYYKPRVDKNLLRKYSEGIIALSGCLAGSVQQYLLTGDYEKAKEEALTYSEIFGEDNFFLEIQDHGIQEQADINPQLQNLSNDIGIPLVATNDVHYTRKEDAQAHDVLLCIQTGAKVDDVKRMRFPTQEFYLKSEEEMRLTFPYAQDACDITEEIADRCNVDFEFGHLHLPEFHAPGEMTNSQYLRDLCEKGLAERYPEGSKELKERLDYELGVIEKMGYVEYFLIVWDFINYAKEHGIMVGPGRGSAAGSIVAYTLKITDIDPIKYNLIFERFLNPERVSMPDIDIDFCYERRHEVIEYVIRKYGKDNVSQIVTFGTMKAKAAIKDVARVMGMEFSEANKLAKMIPDDLKMTIDKALEANPDLEQLYNEDLQIKKIIDIAKKLEGMPRHSSTHAAGVVISKKPIDEYVPMCTSDKGVATQFPMTTIEELGLLKMDFLALRTLTVIRDTIASVEKGYGKKIDFSKMEYDDPAVYSMISKGNTSGVFQLESSGMTQFMKNLAPDCFEDIIAGVSLYRPGPMDSIPTYIENKTNPENIQYLHEKLRPILEVTYGCLVYQEQVMQIVRDLGGYSYGRSDLVRRAMGKKKMEVMLKEKEYFIHGKDDENGNVEIKGCVRNGIPEDVAEKIFDQMVSFAQYAFNKSHAAAYAVIAYETAYLKCHYPVEFMAALMTSFIGNPDQLSKYITDCRAEGIEVLPPDIAKSEVKFSVEDSKVRFGLLGIKGMGKEAAKAVKEVGKCNDIGEFISSAGLSCVNKKAVENLIKSGALSSMGSKAQLLAIYEGLIESAHQEKKKNVQGQISLFSEIKCEARLPKIEEFDAKTLSVMEKEALGLYVTAHPLKRYKKLLEDSVSANSETLENFLDGDTTCVGGIITEIKKIITKENQPMAFVTIEDMLGSEEIVVFPSVYKKYQRFLTEDAIIKIRGSVSKKDGESAKVLADEISDLSQSAVKKIKLKMPKIDTDKMLDTTMRKIGLHPGDCEVLFFLSDGRRIKPEKKVFVDANYMFVSGMQELLGKGNVKTSGIPR